MEKTEKAIYGVEDKSLSLSPSSMFRKNKIFLFFLFIFFFLFFFFCSQITINRQTLTKDCPVIPTGVGEQS